MTVQSFTGNVNTNNEFATVESETGISFTAGNTYDIQVKDSCIFKVADAEFDFSQEKFNYKSGSEDLYIKTNTLGCGLTILEEETA